MVKHTGIHANTYKHAYINHGILSAMKRKKPPTLVINSKDIVLWKSESKK